jgi:hypothetical protein
MSAVKRIREGLNPSRIHALQPVSTLKPSAFACQLVSF